MPYAAAGPPLLADSGRFRTRHIIILSTEPSGNPVPFLLGPSPAYRGEARPGQRVVTMVGCDAQGVAAGGLGVGQRDGGIFIAFIGCEFFKFAAGFHAITRDTGGEPGDGVG